MFTAPVSDLVQSSARDLYESSDILSYTYEQFIQLLSTFIYLASYKTQWEVIQNC